jgi:hypothetical protein
VLSFNRTETETTSSHSAYTGFMLSSIQNRKLTTEVVVGQVSQLVDGYELSQHRVAQVEWVLRQILESTGFTELPDSRMQLKTGLT